MFTTMKIEIGKKYLIQVHSDGKIIPGTITRRSWIPWLYVVRYSACWDKPEEWYWKASYIPVWRIYEYEDIFNKPL